MFKNIYLQMNDDLITDHEVDSYLLLILFDVRQNVVKGRLF